MNLCNECETARYCLKNGCIPISTEGTLDEPIPRWNVLAVLFALLCFALMGAAAVWLA